MNREQYLRFHGELCDEARSLSERKNHDYAGDKGERPFANFERCESMGICSAEQGFLVRMTDKFSRLSGFVQCGRFEVADEKLRDTCLDLINYTCLFMAYMASRRSAAEPTTTIHLGGDYDGE